MPSGMTTKPTAVQIRKRPSVQATSGRCGKRARGFHGHRLYTRRHKPTIAGLQAGKIAPLVGRRRSPATGEVSHEASSENLAARRPLDRPDPRGRVARHGLDARPAAPRPRPTKRPPTTPRSTTKPAKAAPTPENPAPKPGEWEAFVDPENQIFPSLLLASATIKDPLRDKDTADKAEDKKKSGTKKKAPADHAKSPVDPGPEIFGDENGLLGVSLASPARRGPRARRDQGKRVDAGQRARSRSTHERKSLPLAAARRLQVRRAQPRAAELPDQRDVCRGRGRQEPGTAVRHRARAPDQRLPLRLPESRRRKGLRGHRVDVRGLRQRGPSGDPGIAQGSAGDGVVDGFDAYQSNDPGTVLLQVFAVWEALRQHNIRYSDIGTTTSESDRSTACTSGSSRKRSPSRTPTASTRA